MGISRRLGDTTRIDAAVLAGLEWEPPRPAIRPAWAMVDKGLSGQRFPCHVQPQADELLSSWLTRLSLAHGLQPRTFCAILWPTTPI